MRLALPSSSDALDAQFKSKLRSQIRSGARHNFSVHWGTIDLLDDFYNVFSHNMRDLGTPVYPKKLFRAILHEFPTESEVCCLRSAGKPIAAALLIHAFQVTDVPSASSLRAFHSTNANMLMYWNLLQRAISRGSRTFDFGRSTLDSPTYRFKKQWGAVPSPATWQYFVRQGACDALRPENGKFAAAIQVWKRLPVALTRQLGPLIVRGIP
ncbi:MAG: GNAT family N-acetyltransferase [Pirellulaceae bacterium]|jgi:serine/alanine adding enzyme|nr:GNAT family N-acetyltransferase [Pirellulaceae bacterium]